MADERRTDEGDSEQQRAAHPGTRRSEGRRREGERPPRAAGRPSHEGSRNTEDDEPERRPRRRDERPRRVNGPRAAALAATYLAELTGKEFEGIVGIRKSHDDWSVEVEVLEMRRIPSTTDVLAVYEVTVDEAGELVGYERRARYVRGDAREERE
ncbi:gas vesicle protein GvpO [Terrabacter sp. NPDC080008]|uniref:gas vesicle protein GvpO n=1 Tax=Terrabacter sp. NPDC080008 TaxID=3155176 RepID=UPI00344F5FD4